MYVVFQTRLYNLEALWDVRLELRNDDFGIDSV